MMNWNVHHYFYCKYNANIIDKLLEDDDNASVTALESKT